MLDTIEKGKRTKRDGVMFTHFDDLRRISPAWGEIGASADPGLSPEIECLGARGLSPPALSAPWNVLVVK